MTHLQQAASQLSTIPLPTISYALADRWQRTPAAQADRISNFLVCSPADLPHQVDTESALSYASCVQGVPFSLNFPPLVHYFSHRPLPVPLVHRSD